MSNAARVEALFFAALEKGTAVERSAYLDSACGGDAELRRQVEKVLKAHPRVGDFLKKPAVEQLVAAPEQPDGTQEFDTSTDGEGAVPAGRNGPSLARTEGEGAGGDEDGVLDFLQPSARPDSLGRLGHYEVLQVLDRGGFGIVLRAFDDSLQRVVAIKVLAPPLAATSPARKRFLREARSSAKVRHENVVQVYAVEEQPLPYLVMEFIPGETLQQRLNRTGPLETAEVVQIGRQLAEGLAAAHGTGLIHRDIKPANILIEARPHECVKITDFGLARAADDAGLTQSGLLAGTPMFMAPEQALGETLDHRADLFSLGSVLYTMCSGRPPFRASSALAVLRRVAEDTPRPIPEIIPEVPQWLCDLIARLHAKKPEDRFGTAREVADLLARGLEAMQHPGSVPPLPGGAPTAVEKPLPARQIPAAAPPLKPRLRNRRWGIAAAVFLLLLAGLGFTEATGVTNLRGTVIRLFSPEGTLVVEVDDPGVSVKIDGSDLVITGAGAREIRLKPGRYQVEARKDGKLVRRELVTVTKNGRQVVRVSQEAPPHNVKTLTTSIDVAAWERSVAAMTAPEQVKAVSTRLKELNPAFDGKVNPTIKGGVVIGLQFLTDEVDNIAPVRALKGLSSLECNATYTGQSKGKLTDLSPLKGMRLTSLGLNHNQLRDLEPLRGMPLTALNVEYTQVQDLSPLRGMPITSLNLYVCGHVSDLSPLKGMRLTTLVLGGTQVQDLSPLKGMPLTSLNLYSCNRVSLAPLKGLPLTYLYLGGCTQLQDLSPLQGLPLTSLNLSDCTQVRDLEPLKGMPLHDLKIFHAGVTDLKPLQGMSLKQIHLTLRNITQGLDVLRDMKSLTTIGIGYESSLVWPAAEFWERYDKGEFKK